MAEGLLPGDACFREGSDGRPGLSVGTEGPLPLKTGAYASFYEEVEKWVRTGRRPPVDPGDSLLVMQVIEAARESSERQEVVSFSK